jgi:lactoylglutathione lyase
MKIEHIALWTNDLGGMKKFYEKFFDAKPGEIYTNPAKKFTSCFLSFANGDCRLELMHDSYIEELSPKNDRKLTGYAHIAFSVGSKELVNIKTEKLRSAGYVVVSEPRQTGDGYYESVVLDPDGNYLEITI